MWLYEPVGLGLVTFTQISGRATLVYYMHWLHIDVFGGGEGGQLACPSPPPLNFIFLNICIYFQKIFFKFRHIYLYPPPPPHNHNFCTHPCTCMCPLIPWSLGRGWTVLRTLAAFSCSCSFIAFPSQQCWGWWRAFCHTRPLCILSFGHSFR